MVGELAFVGETLRVESHGPEQVAQTFFKDGRKEDFDGGTELLGEIIDVILVVPFAYDEFSVFVGVEVLGVEFPLAEFPEFSIIFLRGRPFTFFHFESGKKQTS
jgi:hypothetical protein